METVGGYEFQFPRPLSDSLILCRLCVENLKRSILRPTASTLSWGIEYPKGSHVLRRADTVLLVHMFCYKSP
jgi:hypothetical protein